MLFIHLGKQSKVDVAVRRNIRTAISQTTGKLQEMQMDEMDCDLVETTAHAGARPSHQVWQGKVFSRSGTSKKYPDFVSSTGYGTITGLLGISCRHDFYPFYEGISKRSYTDEELEQLNNKTVTYNKQEIDYYKATQMQRAMERNIRQTKREIAGYEGIALESKDEARIDEAKTRITDKTTQLKQQKKELKDFIEQTGLTRDRARERISKFDKIIPKRSTIYNENDIMTPSYIRKNVAKGYDTTTDEQVISNAISIMPQSVKKQLENTEFEITTKDRGIRNTSWYDRENNKFCIYENTDIYEVIHEIGHYIETQYKVLTDNKYIEIRQKGLENSLAYEVRDLPNYKDTIGITNSKFISEQQGRIYRKDLAGKSYVAIGGKINLNCLGEYFSEGFREYYQNRSNLKLKDIDLFNYIEELLNNDK